MPQLQKVFSSRNRGRAEYVTDDVAYLTIGFANVYFIGTPGGTWSLVDTGLPGGAAMIRKVAIEVFGGAPEAIILTHGHIDHAGTVAELSKEWRVPVYAHPLELPYLKGRSDYPPKDSSMGGAIAHVARFMTTRGIDLGRRVRALPADGTVPGMDGWRWLHTPGHTAGHVSLFRDSDRTLIAGDAVTTMDTDSWTAIATELASIGRPPAPFTTDWQAAHESVESLIALRPAVLGAGHGVPLYGNAIVPALKVLSRDFPIPRRGRYRTQAAVTDASGVVDVPPPVSDPYPGLMLGVAAGLLIGTIAFKRRRSFVERMFF